MEEAARESRLHRPPPLLQDHPAPHQVRPLCRRHHRLHLGLHRPRRGAHLRLRPRHLGADFLRPEGHRRQPVPLRAGRRDAVQLRRLLRHGQGPVWPRQLRHDGQGHQPRAARSRSRAPARGSAPPCSRGITFLAVLPHLGVVLVAFSSDWYASVLPRNFNLHNFEIALGHDLTVPAIANSLKYRQPLHPHRPRARHRAWPT
jgi:hypothetical protein